MAIPIQRSIKKGGSGGGGVGQLLGTGLGAVVGGIFGGPPGAITGAGLGGTVGGALGGTVAPATPDQQSPGVQTSGDAISRRLGQMRGQDNLVALRDAATSIPHLPPDMQQQYAKPIFDAYQMAFKQRKPGGVV